MAGAFPLGLGSDICDQGFGEDDPLGYFAAASLHNQRDIEEMLKIGEASGAIEDDERRMIKGSYPSRIPGPIR